MLCCHWPLALYIFIHNSIDNLVSPSQFIRCPWPWRLAVWPSWLDKVADWPEALALVVSISASSTSQHCSSSKRSSM